MLDLISYVGECVDYMPGNVMYRHSFGPYDRWQHYPTVVFTEMGRWCCVYVCICVYIGDVCCWLWNLKK